MKNFVIIGVAGYVAPKHLLAIQQTGNNLVAAYDKNDSVGVLDSYFPQCYFFTELERFDRYCEKLQREGNGIDYVVVCSPNYLHDAHIRFGLRIGANVICEKPLVLNTWNGKALIDIEIATRKKVFCLLQLRHHPELLVLKEKIAKSKDSFYNITLHYHTPRGNWYQYSWKGDENKSGGIIKNIGIHLLDMLIWLFGNEVSIESKLVNKDETKFVLLFNNAKATCVLSIKNDEQFQVATRTLTINDDTIVLDTHFEALHTKAYNSILNNEGVSIKESLPSIELATALSATSN